jgi:hypothetical protein
MRRPLLISKLLRRLRKPADRALATDIPAWAVRTSPSPDFDQPDIDEMLTRAASEAREADADWITVLHREFSRLPILPALALLHYINPNDAKAKAIERLKDAPLDDFARTLLTKWRSDRIETASLSLAMAVEYCGVRSEKVEYLALADAIRMMSLSNRSIAMPDSAESAHAISSCAAGVAQALVRDSRDLFGRSDLNREMLANLAFICLGWRSASANMTRFTGSERSFNHIAFGIGHELSRSPDVFHAVAFAETPSAPREQERNVHVATETDRSIVDDPIDPDDIPACFDGPFEDPIIEDLPTGPEGDDPRFSFTRLKGPDGEDLLDTESYADEPMPLPPEPRAARETRKVSTGPSLLVCSLQPDMLKDRRTIEIVTSHRHVIGAPVALVPTPDLAKVRRQLATEFPYAVEAIDLILNDLVGRPTTKFEPLLLLGAPGAGKSRFSRRLAATLGVGLIRTDASRSDGNVFGGTDRRWSSVEPCHPFLAISRTRIANPIMLIEEVDKAAVRTDYGRLWDCMLSFLDVETSQCYPDPALQVEVDVSAISYLFTANDLDNLPHTLRDRQRVIEFPEPKAEHLDALLKPVFDDYLRLRQIDPVWAPPLSQMECAAIAERWKGGSVRKLNRLMIGVMRAREKAVVRH